MGGRCPIAYWSACFSKCPPTIVGPPPIPPCFNISDNYGPPSCASYTLNRWNCSSYGLYDQLCPVINGIDRCTRPVIVTEASNELPAGSPTNQALVNLLSVLFVIAILGLFCVTTFFVLKQRKHRRIITEMRGNEQQLVEVPDDSEETALLYELEGDSQNRAPDSRPTGSALIETECNTGSSMDSTGAALIVAEGSTDSSMDSTGDPFIDEADHKLIATSVNEKMLSSTTKFRIEKKKSVEYEQENPPENTENKEQLGKPKKRTDTSMGHQFRMKLADLKRSARSLKTWKKSGDPEVSEPIPEDNSTGTSTGIATRAPIPTQKTVFVEDIAGRQVLFPVDKTQDLEGSSECSC